MSTSEIDTNPVSPPRKPRALSEDLVREAVAKFVQQPIDNVNEILDSYQQALKEVIESGGQVQFGDLGVMQKRTLQRNRPGTEPGERIEIVKR